MGFPKSLWVNLRLFKLSDAIKLPIIVSHKTRIQSLSGNIKMDSPSFACLKIGFGTIPTADFKYHRPVLNIKGDLIIRGKCRMGIGSKIHVYGVLEIGNHFNMTGNSTIVCHKKITMGSHVLISWNVLIMDTDQHEITDLQGNRINHDEPIKIGSNVWICSGTSIFKGIETGNNIVIGANSVVTRNILEEHVIVAGNPAKIIKKGIKWK